MRPVTHRVEVEPDVSLHVREWTPARGGEAARYTAGDGGGAPSLGGGRGWGPARGGEAARYTAGDGGGAPSLGGGRGWGPARGGEAARYLCVHGLASNSQTWDGVAAGLAGLGHPVATVDLRGHGRSDKPDHGYDFATFADDLVAVLDLLGWEQAVLVGQSTGGNVVVDLAARAPERTAGVAGIDGGAIDLQRRWPAWEDCAAALAPPRMEGTTRRAVEARLRDAHPDWSDEGIEATMANYETLDDGTVRPWLTFEHHLRTLRALWEHRPSEVLACVGTLVLLVLADTGDDWAAAKDDDARLATAAAGGPVEVHWFSPADHDVHVQRPGDLAELLHQTFP